MSDEEMYDKVKYLKGLGFEKVYCEDNSGWWMQKKINHPLLINCQVLVDKHITVYCSEPGNYRDGDYEIVICELDYTIENLQKILTFLKC